MHCKRWNTSSDNLQVYKCRHQEQSRQLRIWTRCSSHTCNNTIMSERTISRSSGFSPENLHHWTNAWSHTVVINQNKYILQQRQERVWYNKSKPSLHLAGPTMHRGISLISTKTSIPSIFVHRTWKCYLVLVVYVPAGVSVRIW